MTEKTRTQFVPFAKIKEEDLKKLLPLFRNSAVQYETKELEDTDENVKALYVDPSSKELAQKIVDNYFKRIRESKAQKESLFIHPDKRIAFATLFFIIALIIKQLMKSGILD